MEKSNIQWTHNTMNPWIGCSHATFTDKSGQEHVHQGCLNCYAEADMDKRRGRAKWGDKGTRSMTSPDYWKQPYNWNRKAFKARQRQRVFCASLADVFEDWPGRIIDHRGRLLCINDAGQIYPEGVPSELPDADDHGQRELTMQDIRDRLYMTIQATPWLDWLLLTKRPRNIRRLTPKGIGYLPNVWLGSSASDQKSLDAVAEQLGQCADLAPVRFLSLEPLLAPVYIGKWADKINWVIAGGESTQIFPARECKPEWLEYLAVQCSTYNMPLFVKQLGGNVTGMKLEDSHGGEIDEWPMALRVRQFPDLSELLDRQTAPM